MMKLTFVIFSLLMVMIVVNADNRILEDEDDTENHGNTDSGDGGNAKKVATKKYKLITKRMHWNSAQKSCAKLSKGSLVVIRNAEEQKAVETYLEGKNIKGTVKKSCFGHKAHGSTVLTAGQRVDPSKRSKFVWKLASGKHVSMNYTNWHKSAPNFAPKQSGPESCLTIWPDKGYQWNDVACGHRPCSLCEYYG